MIKNKQFRRNGGDRRGWRALSATPFKDSEGNTVYTDRRNHHERRIEQTETAKQKIIWKHDSIEQSRRIRSDISR